jgi:hypothetical protein
MAWSGYLLYGLLLVIQPERCHSILSGPPSPRDSSCFVPYVDYRPPDPISWQPWLIQDANRAVPDGYWC